MIWQPVGARDQQREAYRTPPAQRRADAFDAQCAGYVWRDAGMTSWQAQAFRTFATELDARRWGVALPAIGGGWRAVRYAVLPDLDQATAWVERQLGSAGG